MKIRKIIREQLEEALIDESKIINIPDYLKTYYLGVLIPKILDLAKDEEVMNTLKSKPGNGMQVGAQQLSRLDGTNKVARFYVYWKDDSDNASYIWDPEDDNKPAEIWVNMVRGTNLTQRGLYNSLYHETVHWMDPKVSPRTYKADIRAKVKDAAKNDYAAYVALPWEFDAWSSAALNDLYEDVWVIMRRIYQKDDKGNYKYGDPKVMEKNLEKGVRDLLEFLQKTPTIDSLENEKINILFSDYYTPELSREAQYILSNLILKEADDEKSGLWNKIKNTIQMLRYTYTNKDEHQPAAIKKDIQGRKVAGNQMMEFYKLFVYISNKDPKMYKKFIQRFYNIYVRILNLIRGGDPDTPSLRIRFKTSEMGTLKQIVAKPMTDENGRLYYDVLNSVNTLLKPGFKIYPVYKGSKFDKDSKSLIAHIFDENGKKLKGFYHFRNIEIS
jgi:hypothetical protein